MVQQTWNQSGRQNRFDRRPAHPHLAPSMRRREVDRFGSDFRLKNRRDRLRLAVDARAPPIKLRSV
ncbi:MAG: hypothetical protein ACREXP_25670, partial [Steroidobacteraceae bacterium]